MYQYVNIISIITLSTILEQNVTNYNYLIHFVLVFIYIYFNNSCVKNADQTYVQQIIILYLTTIYLQRICTIRYSYTSHYNQ